MISACVLVRSEHGKFQEVTNRLKRLKEVKDVFAVHGRFDVVVDVEAPDFETLGNVVLRVNRMSGIVFTETAVEAKLRGT